MDDLAAAADIARRVQQGLVEMGYGPVPPHPHTQAEAEATVRAYVAGQQVDSFLDLLISAIRFAPEDDLRRLAVLYPRYVAAVLAWRDGTGQAT